MRSNFFIYMMLLVLVACQTLSSSLELGPGATLATLDDGGETTAWKAEIYRLDGRRITDSPNRYRLTPGHHTAEVWVRNPSSERTEPGDDDYVETLFFDVGNNERLAIELRTRRYRTTVNSMSGETLLESAWQELVYPVLVRKSDIEVITTAAASTGDAA